MGRSIRNPDKWIGISISTPLFNRLDYCKTMSHKLNSLLPPYLDRFINQFATGMKNFLAPRIECRAVHGQCYIPLHSNCSTTLLQDKMIYFD